MKMCKHVFARLLAGVIFCSSTLFASAQCEGYGYKQCIKYLDKDYKSNGQSNSAILSPGETTKVNMVFYKGYDYRLVFCAEEHLGPLSIKVYTTKGKTKGELLFDNSQHENAFHWDFTMKATQRLVIEVSAQTPEGEDALDGCVTIALGLRNSAQKGFK